MENILIVQVIFITLMKSNINISSSKSIDSIDFVTPFKNTLFLDRSGEDYISVKK